VPTLDALSPLDSSRTGGRYRTTGGSHADNVADRTSQHTAHVFALIEQVGADTEFGCKSCD
jgi:hypothetical protein